MDLFKDFELFSRALIGSNDVDPTYPMVKSICNHFNFIEEWFIFMYVTFYSLSSGIKMCKSMPSPQDFDPSKFEALRRHTNDFGHERRGKSRNPGMQIKGLLSARELIEDIFCADITEDSPSFIKDNLTFRTKISSLPNHGDWAAFKIAELFEKSAGYKTLKIKDLGLEGRNPNSNDGPVGGLRWLFGRDIKYTSNVYDYWNAYGESLSKAWGVDMGKVETCFCKFHKLKTGKYYVGHDIDEFWDLIEVIGEEDFWHLIDDSGLDRDILSRKGVLKQEKKLYKEEQVIINNHYGEQLHTIDAAEIAFETIKQF